MSTSNPTKLNAFKAYDIRGIVPQDLNDDLAYKIGRAFASEFKPKTMIIGHDIRLESPGLSTALCNGLLDSGVNIIHLGLCGTEEVYFATSHYQADGGIMITASHNPKGYNGMKLVSKGSQPISGDSGLKAIEQRVIDQNFAEFPSEKGLLEYKKDKTAYIEHLLTYVDVANLPKLNIVVNAGNGSAGPAFDCLAEKLPFNVTKLNHEADGNFPNGVPNPMIVENRAITSETIVAQKADMGVAWDGDFDRCFLFDEHGQFIEGYYLVGLLAETLLKNNPGEKIVHDPRLTWNTINQVKQAGGVPIQSKTGHAFIKERMRKEDAIYGGEMSAHHYFRDFFYCDSGMIPWLLIAELMGKTGKSLSQLIEERMKAYPCSGEINYKVKDSQKILTAIQAKYGPENPILDETDGISLEFAEWRMNIRLSNTEPLLRLNVESRANPGLVDQKVKEIEEIIYSKDL
ncbi:phosphomannomutase/phosphoglucomutase [Thiomicrorhabdus sp. Milos-T2]|uniref:phosphomannomutase/phosphoglucomutase n=1 Tax=Thiomicrorhabdus sp. Milos-T2 TaxID=90814 RepID=UPI000494A84B|nr:phosphomannomutase/phosphoglucomutase [Thiomicrorhabdus sp. Milos-T2]